MDRRWRNWFGRTGPLPPGRVVYLLRQLCGALAEAHAAGLVHRDLKPGNVIVTTLGGQRDVAKLLDFGLVQDLSAEAEGRLTRTGTVLGTPDYMSPEQAAGESAVDARSDVYGLGAVAFSRLIGHPPFQGKTFGQLLAAHRSQPPPLMTDLRPDVPADLSAVIARCLAKDPADRFPTVAAVDRELAECDCAAEWSAERAAEWWQAGVSCPSAQCRSVRTCSHSTIATEKTQVICKHLRKNLLLQTNGPVFGYSRRYASMIRHCRFVTWMLRWALSQPRAGRQ